MFAPKRGCSPPSPKKLLRAGRSPAQRRHLAARWTAAIRCMYRQGTLAKLLPSEHISASSTSSRITRVDGPIEDGVGPLPSDEGHRPGPEVVGGALWPESPRLRTQERRPRRPSGIDTPRQQFMGIGSTEASADTAASSRTQRAVQRATLWLRSWASRV